MSNRYSTWWFSSFYLGEVHLGKKDKWEVKAQLLTVITTYYIIIEGYDNDRPQASCRSWHSCSFDSFSSTSDYTIYIAFLFFFLLRFHIPIFMVDNNSVGERKWLQSKNWLLFGVFLANLLTYSLKSCKINEVRCHKNQSQFFMCTRYQKIEMQYFFSPTKVLVHATFKAGDDDDDRWCQLQNYLGNAVVGRCIDFVICNFILW